MVSVQMVNRNCSGAPLFQTLAINPLSPNSVQDQFSPYNYPYTVKR